MNIQQFIDEQLELEAKATASPWSAQILLESLPGETAEETQQALDSLLVTAARNNYKPVLLALKYAIEVLNEKHVWLEPYVCTCTVVGTMKRILAGEK